MVIRPMRFSDSRVENVLDLHSIVERSQVRGRGWYFPHVDDRIPPSIGTDWLGQETAFEHYREVWRAYQSGQFADISGMVEDWRSESTLWSAPAGWKTGQWLGIGTAVLILTERLEFAARLAMSPAGDNDMHLDLRAGNLAGRSLVVDDPQRAPFNSSYTSSLQQFEWRRDISRAQLVADSRSLALGISIELFRRFGWNAQPEIIRDLQAVLRA